MRIQQAQPADAPIIAPMAGELLHEIMEVTGERAFGVDTPATEARARAWLAKGTALMWLAWDRESEKACGFVAAYEGCALYAEGTFGTISELFVRPPYRSQGVGSGLVEAVKRFARQRQWARLEVTTPPLPHFDRTLAFYARHGFSISGGCKMKVAL